MPRDYFEDCQIGDRFVSPGRTITETDVVMFAALTGDWNPIHTDAAYARQTEFGERIAHGMLTLVAGTGLLFRSAGTDLLPRKMIALADLDRVRFVGPVRLGDTITLEIEIADLTPMGDSRGLVQLSFRINNQHAATVLTGRFKVQVQRRPPTPET